MHKTTVNILALVERLFKKNHSSPSLLPKALLLPVLLADSVHKKKDSLKRANFLYTSPSPIRGEHLHNYTYYLTSSIAVR